MVFPIGFREYCCLEIEFLFPVNGIEGQRASSKWRWMFTTLVVTTVFLYMANIDTAIFRSGDVFVLGVLALIFFSFPLLLSYLLFFFFHLEWIFFAFAVTAFCYVWYGALAYAAYLHRKRISTVLMGLHLAAIAIGFWFTDGLSGAWNLASVLTWISLAVFVGFFGWFIVRVFLIRRLRRHEE